MSRYYFHSVTADGILKDDVGVEVEEAKLRTEAIKAVFELEAEFAPRGEDLIVQSFWIVDEGGRTILELPFREGDDPIN
jgi:hypothetical protein